MAKVTLTVAEIKWPAEGKARGNITATDGRKFGCFKEKFGLFQPNGTYEVEISDGQYQNVVSAKLLSAAAPDATQSFTSGAYRPPATGNGAAASAEHDDHNKNQQIFVCALLKEFIRANKVELEERSLANAVNMLKRLPEGHPRRSGRHVAQALGKAVMKPTTPKREPKQRRRPADSPDEDNDRDFEIPDPHELPGVVQTPVVLQLR